MKNIAKILNVINISYNISYQWLDLDIIER